MESINISFLVFKALESLAPLATSKVSMFDVDDKYGHPPFIRFRFKGVLKNDKIYSIIKFAVENFSGNVKWKLSTKPSLENYILITSFFAEFTEFDNFYKKEFYISKLGENLYTKMIDDAIEDIPMLSKLISSCR